MYFSNVLMDVLVLSIFPGYKHHSYHVEHVFEINSGCLGASQPL